MNYEITQGRRPQATKEAETSGPAKSKNYCLPSKESVVGLIRLVSLLHLMASALAIENVSRFSGAFAFATTWLIAAADVGANLVAADDLLFWRSDRFLLDFSHFHGSLGGVGIGRIECKSIITHLGRSGKANPILQLPRPNIEKYLPEWETFCSCKSRPTVRKTPGPESPSPAASDSVGFG